MRQGSPQQGSETSEFHGARAGVNEGHPEDQEAGSHTCQDQIFHSRLDADRSSAKVGDHAVEAHAQGLQPQEEGGEVAAGRQEDRPQGGQQKEDVKLVRISLLLLEVSVRETRYGGGRCEEQTREDQRKAIQDEE